MSSFLLNYLRRLGRFFNKIRVYEYNRNMKSYALVLYVVVMAAIIVSVDLMFFRDHPWERLAVNIGIVLVFAAVYFRVLK